MIFLYFQILPEVSGPSPLNQQSEFSSSVTSVSVSGSPVHAAVVAEKMGVEGDERTALLLALPAHKCESARRVAALAEAAARSVLPSRVIESNVETTAISGLLRCVTARFGLRCLPRTRLLWTRCSAESFWRSCWM